MKFRIQSGVTYEKYTFDYLARKKAYHATAFGFGWTCFIFCQFGNVDVATLRDYAETCFKYSLKNRLIPLPWGLLHGVYCYAAVVTRGVQSDVADMVRNTQPPIRWSGYVIPVICDLANGDLHYWRNEVDRDWLDAFPKEMTNLMWLYVRETIERVLSPGE